LAELCNDLEGESSQLKKIELLIEFLSKLDDDEIEVSILLIIGRIFPDESDKTLNISYKIIQSLISKSSKQRVLVKRDYSIKEIYEVFRNIAELSGAGSITKKKNLILSLFIQLSEIEKRYLIRMILGEMRIGVSEGVMLFAIADASNIDREKIKNAYMFYGNLGEIGKIALKEGINGIEKIQIKIFRPIKPMLAEMAESIDKILNEHTKNSVFEYKYDGIRVQLHKSGEKLKLYTRKLNEISEGYHELLQSMNVKLNSETLILDGELVAINKDNKPYPFQDLMKKKSDNIPSDINYRIYIFDILFLNGESLLHKPLKIRKEILNDICSETNITNSIFEKNINKIKDFFEKSIDSGHEGIIGKDLDSIYFVGRRKKAWLKLKKDYELDLVIIAADWGSGRRRGWLSNYHLAIRGKHNDYKMVGKTFKGLSDQEFKEMTERLLGLKIDETRNTVIVEPKIVVEVTFNEIQRSPKYESGFALRFARIKNIRFDKSINEINSIDDLTSLYNYQYSKKASI
jgi:DNA ligase-1